MRETIQQRLEPAQMSLENGTTRTQQPAAPKRIKTLLVDDSPIMLELLARIMAQEREFEVVGTATDGHKALFSAAMLAPELVVADLHMPHLNGAQVTQCLKDFESPPVVFIVTADNTAAARHMSEAAGAEAFILKGGDLQAQLHSQLEQWFCPASTAAANDFGKRTCPHVCGAPPPQTERCGPHAPGHPAHSLPAARACASLPRGGNEHHRE